MCDKDKDVSEFYKTSKGGVSARCRECTKTAVRDNRRKKIDYYREFDRDRANLPHRVAARYDYIRTEQGKAAKARALAAYIERDPVRAKAHNSVSNAIRDGKLHRASHCEECRDTVKIEGHHDDYTKPLEVRWLCEKCHKSWHRSNTPIYGTSDVA